MMQLDELLKVHPYLEPGATSSVHPLQYWVTRRELESAQAQVWGVPRGAFRSRCVHTPCEMLEADS